MGRAIDHSSEHYPWTRPDMLPHAIASAGWGARYPGIRYDERSKDRFVPQDIVKQTLLQERFAVVVWQESRVSFIDLSHIPERTFMSDEDLGRSDVDWANIKHYELTKDGPIFSPLDMREYLDPREIMPSVYAILATPLDMAPGPQMLVAPDRPINRMIIEFPSYQERRRLPLNTTIAVLGGVATQEYLDTIYGSTEV